MSGNVGQRWVASFVPICTRSRVRPHGLETILVRYPEAVQGSVGGAGVPLCKGRIITLCELRPFRSTISLHLSRIVGSPPQSRVSGHGRGPHYPRIGQHRLTVDEENPHERHGIYCARRYFTAASARCGPPYGPHLTAADYGGPASMSVPVMPRDAAVCSECIPVGSVCPE
jgi:hypothetical protein